LNTHFKQFGDVTSVKIPKSKTGETLNYGYLSFNDRESRDKCINSCSNKLMNVEGQSVEVQSFVPYNKRERI